MKKDNIFRRWARLMGHNDRQIAEAADTIGVGQSTSYLIGSERRPATKTELLAMAAVRAGLEPWSLETDAHCRMLRSINDMVQDRIASSNLVDAKDDHPSNA